MFAARIGYSEIVQNLLNEDALVDLTDNEGHSAMWYAKNNCHDDIVAMLNSANQ